jgi:hypothetical protein
MGYETIPLDYLNVRHRDALLKLWTENMSDTRIADVADARMRWFYAENPIAQPTTILSTYGEPPEVIGCGSTLSGRIWATGKMIVAGIQCDFAVTRKHRIGAAAMAIQRALIATSRTTGQAFMLAFPNDMSLPIFKRVGYEVVAEAHGWVKPLRSFLKLQTLLRSSLAAKAASLVVDAGLRAADAARYLPFRGRYRSEILDRADTRFDSLWERARGQHLVAGDKTSAFLNWRYADFKTRRHQFFTLTDTRTEQLVGFVVFAVEDNKAFIVNLFAADLVTTLTPLLLAFSSAMRKSGHVGIFIIYAGQPSFGQRLEKLLFRRSKHSARNLAVFVDKQSDPGLAAYVLDAGNWLLFDGEMDI